MKKQRGSWLSLVMLCLVTALSAALGLGVLFAAVSAVFAVVRSPSVSDENRPEATAQDSLSGVEVSPTPIRDEPASDEAVASRRLPAPGGVVGGKTADSGAESGKTLVGMITDARCGARHSRNSNKTSAECANSWVGNGSRYVLVDGEEVHGLEGDRAQLDRLAGVRVEVVGRLVGDRIEVESIRAR